MMVMRLRYMVLSQYRPASYLLSLILPSLLTGALCRWPLVSGLPVALLSLLLCMLTLPWCFPIGRQSTPAWLIPNRTLWPALALLHHLMVTLLSLGMCAVVVHLFHPQLPFDLTVLKPLWPIWALWTGFRLLLESRMGQDGRALALLPLMVLCTLPFGFDILKPVQNLPPITAVVAVALIALALIPVPAQLLRPKTEGDTP